MVRGRERLEGHQVGLEPGELRLEVERSKVLEQLVLGEGRAEIAAGAGHARGEEGRAPTRVRQHNPCVAQSPLPSGGHEVGGRLVGLVGYLAHRQGQEVIRPAVAAAGLVTVHEHHRIAAVQFRPQRVEGIGAEVTGVLANAVGTDERDTHRSQLVNPVGHLVGRGRCVEGHGDAGEEGEPDRVLLHRGVGGLVQQADGPTVVRVGDSTALRDRQHSLSDAEAIHRVDTEFRGPREIAVRHRPPGRLRQRCRRGGRRDPGGRPEK